jgi:16S rRNA (adenine1518-N6/adenine1519-N6)-dimethyltransferase
VRVLAGRFGVRPTKRLGQNFVVDANTVRRIVRIAELDPADTVIEVGPGLGSLTLGLLAAARRVIAVEIDPVLAAALRDTVAERRPALAGRLRVLNADALQLASADSDGAHGRPVRPTALVANLPYNVSVPVLLTLFERFPSIRHATVMVQAEVADRLAARPGSRVYGAPSVKLAWYGRARRVADISRTVFWPVPNVDSALVRVDRHDRAAETAYGASRAEVFAVVDAAFAQRRKTLRAALAAWAGGPAAAESVLRAAGVDPTLRGERLELSQFVCIARQRARQSAG